MNSKLVWLRAVSLGGGIAFFPQLAGAADAPYSDMESDPRALYTLLASTAVLKLTIYHTNDIHGWLMSRRTPADAATGRRFGGAAALAAVVRGDPGPKLLLDAGDWFQGTPEGTLSKGRSVVEMFNALGYDAVEVGNHDFDLGEARLKELVGALKIPALGANVYDHAAGTRVKYLKPYVLKEISGIKIGIFGLVTIQTPVFNFAKNTAGLDFRREVDEAKDMVRELKARGATVVIAVTHVGLLTPVMSPFEDERYLAAQVPGIDLIVGGHTHTMLRTPVRDPEHGTLIVQAGSYLTAVGKATLEVNLETKRVVRSTGTLVDLWVDQTGEDPELGRMVGKYWEEIGRALEVVVGTATETLTRNPAGEASLGDWMTDCTRARAGTELAFQNGRGIRADLPAGPVTLRRLFEIMPFENYVVTFKIAGRHIRENLEHGIGGASHVLQVSGLRFKYHPDAKQRRHVTSVWVGDRPLEDDRIYTASTLDYVYHGGDGYAFSRGSEPVFTDMLERDVLAWCARERGPIQAAPLDRIVKETGAGSVPENPMKP